MKNKVRFNGQFITPSKVVCVGRNYLEHIKELDNKVSSEPVIFSKPNTAISEVFELKGNDVIHYEAELAFIVDGGQLVGVGLGLDLTKRKVQNELKNKGLPWERAKAFDRSAVCSEFVPLPDEIKDLHLELKINGQMKQQGGYSMMIHKPLDLLNEINSFMTLEDHDILFTGTPAGVGQVHHGDEFVGRVYSGDALLLESKWLVKS